MAFFRQKKRRLVLTNRNVLVSGAPAPPLYVSRHGRKVSWKYKTSVGFVFVLLVLVGVSLVLTRLPIFAITTVTITDAVENQSLVADLSHLKGKSLVLFDTKKSVATLSKKYPQARYIAIKKKLPNTLLITIDARSPIAILTAVAVETVMADTAASSSSAVKKITTGTSYYLDTEGVPYRILAAEQNQASSSSAQAALPGLPTVLFKPELPIELGRKITSPIVARVIEIVPEAQTRALVFTTFTDQALEGATDSANGFTANLSGGISVIFSQEKPGLEQVAALQTILDSTKIERGKIKKIDLRFIKPYVTLK